MRVKKVKSRQKLAETTPIITLTSMQFAQADVYYFNENRTLGKGYTS